MYEKGSVQRGSRQQQTRKDEDHMKKFLSLLLALTMVLSLVVVPARAADGDEGHNCSRIFKYCTRSKYFCAGYSSYY